MTSNAEIMVFNEIKRRALTKEQVFEILDEMSYPIVYSGDVDECIGYLYGRGYVVIPLVECNGVVIPPQSKYDNKKDVFEAITDAKKELIRKKPDTPPVDAECKGE